MRLLLVEDEVKIANSLNKGLVNEGFSVDVAYDGAAGMSLATTEEYDVIILDLMLPKFSGLDILNRLRDESNKTPVLILTAKDAIQDKVNGLNLGADDYLAKPFSFTELLARIRALIRRSTNTQPILTVADLKLDPYNKLVWRAEQEVQLSAKEFALLEYMIRRKGAVLSETHLLNHVWDHNFDGMSNVVAVHIKNLRHKIDKAFPKSPQLIYTIRGLGYKIDG